MTYRLLTCFNLLFLCVLSKAQAQMTPDLTLPNNTTIQINGNITTINGGTQVGNNLFHSFKDFSIPTGTSIRFNNGLDVQNIITRITGGSASNIDGLISANGTANLFLISPSGIIFGPNARLDIGGSFLATTADALEFPNASFSATNPQKPLLTVNVPTGLSFGSNPGNITVQGVGSQINRRSDFAQFTHFTGLDESYGLKVKLGRSLSLVGGNLSLVGGNVTSDNGRIELASINSAFVEIKQTEHAWMLSHNQTLNFGNIELSKKALVNTTASEKSSIQVYAANLKLTDGSVILIQNNGDKLSGDINIYIKDSLSLIGASLDNNITSIATESLSGGAGGNINIAAENLFLIDGGGITTNAFNDGRSGNINLNISNSIEIFRTPENFIFRKPSNITSSTFSNGYAGLISITSPKIRLTNGSIITSKSLGLGDSGNINIDSHYLEINGSTLEDVLYSFINTGSFKQGNSGNIVINTSQLKLFNGGAITTNSIASGSAGTVIINASDLVEVIGTEPRTSNPTFIASYIEVEKNENFRRFLGIPEIPSGSAGSIFINSQTLKVQQDAEISVKNEGRGNAGIVKIDANIVSIENGSINATTVIGQGGNISFTSQNLQFKNGNLSTTAGTNGNGGNININTDILAASNNSSITANAFEGRGGNIQINTKGLFLSPDSQITASSERGINGTVQINADTYLDDVTGKPEVVLETPKITSICQGRSSGNSELFITGTGGLAPNPEDLPDTQSTWQGNSNKEISQLTTSNDTTEIVEAQGWVKNPDGSVTLTAQANVVNPGATQSADSCNSDKNTTG